MKHFGNSLSYEEIIEDMKAVKAGKTEPNILFYTGIQTTTVETGNYVNGKFVKSGKSRVYENHFSIRFLNNKWYLGAEGDGGYFDTVKQAKDAARRAFGNGIKWTAK